MMGNRKIDVEDSAHPFFLLLYSHIFVKGATREGADGLERRAMIPTRNGNEASSTIETTDEEQRGQARTNRSVGKTKGWRKQRKAGRGPLLSILSMYDKLQAIVSL